MPKSISSKYYSESKIVCGSCHTEYIVDASYENLKIDVCGNCHPAYTGKSILVGTAGQLKKFQDRVAKQSTSPIVKSVKTKIRKSKQSLINTEAEVA
jgi:large subunit ribosomal protein L31